MPPCTSTTQVEHYSDPNQKVDLKKGLPRLREPWIQERDVERLTEISSEYGKVRLADKSLDSLRFDHITLPYRAKAGKQITQMYYAKMYLLSAELFSWSIVVIVVSLVIEKCIIWLVKMLYKCIQHI